MLAPAVYTPPTDMDQETNVLINTDKKTILSTLLGLQGGAASTNSYCLKTLYDNHFKGLINEDFTQYDLQELQAHVSPDLLGKKKPKVKKGNYLDWFGKQSQSHITFKGEDQRLLIGASSVECAVWFHFTNELDDVNNGVIYVRKSSTGKIVKMTTFEVNPFVKGIPKQAVRGYQAADSKSIISFNPAWLTHTLDAMDNLVFKPLKK